MTAKNNQNKGSLKAQDNSSGTTRMERDTMG